ncbi:MAG: hypothetical protein IPM11_00410 [Micropruina sp.]|nr:hypothetical protein [Micropruina sp.]
MSDTLRALANRLRSKVRHAVNCGISALDSSTRAVATRIRRVLASPSRSAPSAETRGAEAPPVPATTATGATVDGVVRGLAVTAAVGVGTPGAGGTAEA